MKRTPMTRTQFKRRAVVHQPAVEREPRPLARLERSVTYAGSTGAAVPKEPAPIRDEAHRRWVATLPCYECRIQGYSQCAHPNSGKAKGVKLSDAGCFPMCADRPGVKGCHARFDQYEIVPRAEMPAYEARALQWTREQRSTQ